MLHSAAAQQEEDEVGHDHAVAGTIGGLVLVAVDVATDNTIDVAPADDEAEGDAALVDALGVVGGPGDGVGDTGVDPQRAEKGAGVLHPGGCAAEQHREPHDPDQRHPHVAQPALPRAVGQVADEDGHDACDGVRRNGEKLGFGRRFEAELAAKKKGVNRGGGGGYKRGGGAYAVHDGREKEGKGVEGSVTYCDERGA